MGEGTGGALKPLVNCFPELLKSYEIVIIVVTAFFKNIEFDKKNRDFFSNLRQVLQMGEKERGKMDTEAR